MYGIESTYNNCSCLLMYGASFTHMVSGGIKIDEDKLKNPLPDNAGFFRALS